MTLITLTHNPYCQRYAFYIARGDTFFLDEYRAKRNTEAATNKGERESDVTRRFQLVPSLLPSD